MAGTIPGWKPEAVVAVAPFQAWGSECLGPWFGSAVARHLTRALGQLPGIHVISFDSMMAYAPGTATCQIGVDVGTRYLVRGQIIGLGDDCVEYRASLYDARSSDEMTQISQPATFASCMDLQGEIIPRLLHPLERAIRTAEMTRVVLPTTRQMLALERVEKAIPAILSLDEGAFNRAGVWLQEATRLDPGYALAWAWLATWHTLRVGQGWSKDRTHDAAEALACARRAVDLDSGSSLALARIGHIHSYLGRDYTEAQRYFRMARKANGNDSFALALSSFTKSYVGRSKDARLQAAKALHLSPRDPMLFYFELAAAHAEWVSGDYSAAESFARSALLRNGSFTSTHRLLAAILIALDRDSEAHEIADQHRVLAPDFYSASTVSTPFRNRKRNNLLLQQWYQAGIIANEPPVIV